MLNKLKTWFANLTQREQRLVSGGAISFTVLVFYYLIWSPLNTALHTQQRALSEQQELLLWVQEQASRAAQLRQSNQQVSFTGSLTQLVNQTTRSSGISVSRMQPQNDYLQVTIDSVPFNALLTWLNTLESRGVMILQADITETDNPGIVQVRRLQLGNSN